MLQSMVELNASLRVDWTTLIQSLESKESSKPPVVRAASTQKVVKQLQEVTIKPMVDSDSYCRKIEEILRPQSRACNLQSRGVKVVVVLVLARLIRSCYNSPPKFKRP